MKKNSIIKLAVAAALSGMATCAGAGGFAIGTQSGSGTGNAFAGGAAAADDASVAWSNPAAMTLLPSGKQVAGALHVLKPSFKYQDSGSTGFFSCTAPFPACPGGNGGDGGDWAFVPNAFFAMDINPKLRLGVAINVPFGLVTEYEAGWRGAVTALKSEIKTMNINPSIAYEVTPAFSIGAGLSFQRLEAELTAFGGAAAIGNINLGADDDGWGYNIGAMFRAGPGTRFGVHYRSSIKYNLEGDVVITGPGGALLGGNGAITAALRVPETLSFSASHMLTSNWEIMGDITWTKWSRLQQLVVTRTSGPAAGTNFTTLGFGWDDSWRFGVGANYKVNEQMKLRFGAAFDQTPTNDTFRTARLPDQDRTWLAFGMQYKVSKAGVIDWGYAHEFIKDASVRNATTAPLPAGTLIGRFENKADIFSVQYSHSF
jgi:long-chain fatty acid transport protein